MYVYAGKINGLITPQFPGPYIQAFQNMPSYLIWSNKIDGQHFLPVDRTHPFNMVQDFLNQVPVVPHVHGLESQMGSDGQPLGFWTKSGRKGQDYFSLSSSNKRQWQAIYRYHNTKQGLLWYHDHSMAITRLNCYAGLVGYYEIVNPQISIQQKNILRYYGDLERKHFVITDKTFNSDGSLYYPNISQSRQHTSWVPQFFGNTITVNGVVWPKVTLRPQKYRIVFLNGCQSRYLNIFFENNGKKLNFQIFRRDSDYLNKPVAVKQHLLMIGGRIQIFIDLTGIKGQVILRNDAAICQLKNQYLLH